MSGGIRVGDCGGAPGAGEKGGGCTAEDLSDRDRHNLLAVLQFLQAKGHLEALVALEGECGVQYHDGALPSAGVLESSLDMFGRYQEDQGKSGDGGDGIVHELRGMKAGACCTGPLSAGTGGPVDAGANVTAVCWAARRFDEHLALVASADRRVRLLSAAGVTLAELGGLQSTVLAIDCCALPGPSGFLVAATTMGGETNLWRLSNGASASAEGPADGAHDGRDGGSPPWTFEELQVVRDHKKHATGCLFSPAGNQEDGSGLEPGAHFLTKSRDHTARVYRRSPENSTDRPAVRFEAAGVVRASGDVTACCWMGARSFAVAVRDDHNLHYWDLPGGQGGELVERCKVNLNALGDSVVSFAVLDLALSPCGRMVAACTDKSRIIVLQAYSPMQLRNLYGAVVEEYDTPRVCFSLDGTLLYASSSLTYKAAAGGDDAADERLADSKAMCGQLSVFELGSGEQVLTLPCHERSIRCADRHPLSEALVTGSFDRTVRFWG